MRYLVILEGELRGCKSCIPSIKKHLVDHLVADMMAYTQNYVDHDKNAMYVGDLSHNVSYDNPNDMGSILDKLCSELYVSPDWRKTFKQVRDKNWTLGFKRKGTCIRRMYNRHLIYKFIVENNLEYDYYVLTRSDHMFVNDFNPPIGDKLIVSNVQSHGGINSNLLVVPKSQLHALEYCKVFLDGSVANLKGGLNEEQFFMRCIQLLKIPVQAVKNTWFISGDTTHDYKTWGNFFKCNSTGFIYKKPEEFDSAMDKSSSEFQCLSIKQEMT